MKFNSQICTTEEQSKRLLALGLKAETADMSYRINYFDLEGMLLECVHTLEPNPPLNSNRYIPAWSFHRLLELCDVFYLGHRDYDSLINYLEDLIKEDYFNKDYLEE